MKPRAIIGIIFFVVSLLKLATIWGFIHWCWFAQVTEQPWATYFCIFVVLYVGVHLIIDIHTFCGGIELFVPTHVNVVVKSRSFIGGVGNHATHTSDPKAPTLHIVASNFFGGVDVKI